MCKIIEATSETLDCLLKMDKPYQTPHAFRLQPNLTILIPYSEFSEYRRGSTVKQYLEAVACAIGMELYYALCYDKAPTRIRVTTSIPNCSKPVNDLISLLEKHGYFIQGALTNNHTMLEAQYMFGAFLRTTLKGVIPR
jgi:hypothetical protein